MKRLKVTNDYVFKKIFGEKKNSDILKDLLQAILTDIKIDTLEVNKEVSLEKELVTSKFGILDIVATLDNGTKVNIEMQVKNEHNTIERSIFYEAGMYYTSLEKNKDYIKIPRNISIWILDYDLFEEGPFHETARLKRDYENILLTDKFEIHYIQLPKFKRRHRKISSVLDEWLTFISSKSSEDIAMINNKYVKKAEEELEYLTGDEAERRIAELREKAIRDEAAALDGAKTRGIEEGIKKEKIQITKKMLEENVDINIIIKVTGLAKEEIEKIKDNK